MKFSLQKIEGDKREVLCTKDERLTAILKSQKEAVIKSLQ